MEEKRGEKGDIWALNLKKKLFQFTCYNLKDLGSVYKLYLDLGRVKLAEEGIVWERVGFLPLFELNKGYS